MHSKQWALMVSVRKLLSSHAVICCHVSSNIIVSDPNSPDPHKMSLQWSPLSSPPERGLVPGELQVFHPRILNFTFPLLRLYRIPAAAFPVFSTHTGVILV